ncbi:hypothetical protein A2164_04245 [Candidatus Curtissbacteria bacterium RBG_13_35_7]|uniref:M23ase beta-sheet core domain-containing protein n=1 Tax=Candidatus Curtissbacteria bacterium RBG_13_35_7 TaxID=1797705 RepID=A0A1F5G539_9BACT|nr:MAG: hypothetical protein A2164_04245 [Candidatus Curtissbacteria bacterium RBG_13_35_7]
MNLKKSKIPDKVRSILKRTGRKYKSIILRHPYVKTVRRYGRMDAKRALKLVYKGLSEQVRIRPRIRLVVITTLVLLTILALTHRGANYLEAKEPEIKINDQAILVAEKADEASPPVEIEARVEAQKSPFEFNKPVEGYISQGYRNYHRAVDIATGAVGVPVKPLGVGQVEFTGYSADGKGNIVIVDHGNDLKSLYAHMGQISVGVGNEVTTDSTLGTVGMTGRTTGPHVHLEIYDNGIVVDPAKVLPE